MTFRSTIAGAAMLAAHQTAAQEHRYEADPVASVRENFVVCDVLSQLILASCWARSGTHLCKPRPLRLHLSAPDNYNLQMDSLESVIEMKPTGPLPA